MKSIVVPATRVTPRASDVLEERAQALSRASLADAHESDVAMVGFHLGNRPYAVELGLVEKVVSRLDDVVPLAGSRHGICGVTFVDNLPHLVVDLSTVATGRQRGLLELVGVPALVFRRDGATIAIAVEAPLELTEGGVVPYGSSEAREEQSANMQISGRLTTGPLVISSVWIRHWVTSVGAGG